MSNTISKLSQGYVAQVKQKNLINLTYQFLAMLAGLALLNSLCWGYELGEARLYGTLLGVLCFVPIFLYTAKGAKGVHILPIITGFYFLHFSLPAFLSAHSFESPRLELLVSTLQLCCIGVAALIVGDWGGQRLGYKFKVPMPTLDPQRTLMVSLPWLLLAVVYIALTIVQGWRFFGNFEAIAYVVLNPYLPATLLLGHYFRGHVNRWIYIIVLSVLGLLVLIGLLGGSLMPTLMPLFVYTLARWDYLGRLPLRFVAALFIVFIILQPAKIAYRDVVWYGTSGNVSMTGNLLIYADKVIEKWGETTEFNIESDEVQSSIQRLDNLFIFSRAVEFTPGLIPYQYGATYVYFLYTWVPRFLWPDKPIAREANDWFALNYEFSLASQIGETVVGMPQITEGYINFGAVGVLVSCVLMGMIYGILTGLFGECRAGIGGSAILLTFLTNLTGIESSTGQLFGSLIQQTLIYVFMLQFMKERGSISVTQPGLAKLVTPASPIR